VEGGAPDGYSAADVQEMMQETGDKNIYRWLSEDRGVQIDPHSHEGYAFGDSVAYNYADVAQLIDEIGVSPSGIVGGHVISEDSYQDWPRFKTPLKAAHDESYSWTATALIGGGTANHSGELEGSGIWFPTEPGSPPDYDNYYRNDASSDLPAVGNWPGDALDPLLAQLGPIRTATVAINQSDLVMAACGTLDNEDQIADLGSCDFETAAADSIAANIAPLMTHPVVGFRTFNGLLDIWKTDFGGEAALCTGYGDDCTAAF
jgi:hypothetical protein